MDIDREPSPPCGRREDRRCPARQSATADQELFEAIAANDSARRLRLARVRCRRQRPRHGVGGHTALPRGGAAGEETGHRRIAARPRRQRPRTRMARRRSMRRRFPGTMRMRVLLDHGADIDARDAGGKTPLHNAVIVGRIDAAIVPGKPRRRCPYLRQVRPGTAASCARQTWTSTCGSHSNDCSADS